MTRSRDGFALIAVLWLVAALAVLLTVGMRPARLAADAAQNRLGRARALWAARGCLALLQARNAGLGTDVDEGPVALGPATWCTLEPFDWDVRINPNIMDSLGLMRVLDDSVRVASLLDWIDEDDTPREAGAEEGWYRTTGRVLPRNGTLAAVAELTHIRGFEEEPLDSLEALFTVRGNGSVSPDRASALVLSSVSALSDSDVARLVAIRSSRRSFASVESVCLSLGMDPTPDTFRELALRLSIRPTERTFRVYGWTDVGDRVVRSRIDVELMPVDGELAISTVEIT